MELISNNSLRRQATTSWWPRRIRIRTNCHHPIIICKQTCKICSRNQRQAKIWMEAILWMWARQSRTAVWKSASILLTLLLLLRPPNPQRCARRDYCTTKWAVANLQVAMPTMPSHIRIIEISRKRPSRHINSLVCSQQWTVLSQVRPNLPLHLRQVNQEPPLGPSKRWLPTKQRKPVCKSMRIRPTKICPIYERERRSAIGRFKVLEIFKGGLKIWSNAIKRAWKSTRYHFLFFFWNRKCLIWK